MLFSSPAARCRSEDVEPTGVGQPVCPSALSLVGGQGGQLRHQPHEVLGIEGLREELICPGLPALDGIPGARLGRENDDSCAGGEVRLLPSVEHRDPIDARHHQIEDHAVRWTSAKAKRVKSLGSTRSLFDRVALALEENPKHPRMISPSSTTRTPGSGEGRASLNDLVQYRTGEGPCLAAISEVNVVRIDVLEGDSRFIRFAPGALDHEIESVLSIPLISVERVVGALNMYSHLPEAFDANTEEEVQPMADVAAEAIGTSPLYAFALDMVEGLMETLESKALINQAVGVIIAGEGRPAEEALERVRHLAFASGQPMRAVAQFALDDHPTTPPPFGDPQPSNRHDA